MSEFSCVFLGPGGGVGFDSEAEVLAIWAVVEFLEAFLSSIHDWHIQSVYDVGKTSMVDWFIVLLDDPLIAVLELVQGNRILPGSEHVVCWHGQLHTVFVDEGVIVHQGHDKTLIVGYYGQATLAAFQVKLFV